MTPCGKTEPSRCADWPRDCGETAVKDHWKDVARIRPGPPYGYLHVWLNQCGYRTQSDASYYIETRSRTKRSKPPRHEGFPSDTGRQLSHKLSTRSLRSQRYRWRQWREALMRLDKCCAMPSMATPFQGRGRIAASEGCRVRPRMRASGGATSPQVAAVDHHRGAIWAARRRRRPEGGARARVR